ncbi:phosphatidylethanolamine-binding protein [Multifurca ochricompacta]|uniref:Phosphatidylethanolamine-binding protein n=1 Tax=Multifurca ochricompacta TaxID=376703 RepID=A0AAD4M997_9AGAM|nr:phosphatidylethanolamine-binding protein [Multifurca ochricompacta]
MLRLFNLWAFLLPGLLVKASPPDLGDSSLAKVRQKFEDFNIPANVHLTFDPVVLFELTFPEPGAAPIHVMAGEQLERNATAGPPQFALRSDHRAATGHGPFVIVAVDPDAPTPQAPTVSQIRHFLGGGFQFGAGHKGMRTLVNDTPAITEFRQPTPPAGSDPHRYVFLLFKEPSGFSQQTLVNSSTSIAHFNISAFADATGLGNPLGGTFIRVGPQEA